MLCRRRFRGAERRKQKMKKIIGIFAVVFSALSLFAEDDPNYNNGNGTIINKKNEKLVLVI